MSRRVMVCMGLLVACLAASAGAATGPTKAATPAGAPAAKKAVAPARTAGARKTAAAAGTAAGAKKATAPATGRPVAAPRRLEDIHIEGEIPAPQVLFVTARDQRRFTRFHHQRYLKTSRQVGEETLLPARIASTRKPSTHSGTR